MFHVYHRWEHEDLKVLPAGYRHGVALTDRPYAAMTAFLILSQFALFAFLLKIADSMAKQRLTLRWAQTQHSVLVQRQTVGGLWIPYGKQSFGDSQSAQEWINSEIARHKAEIGDRFGPVTVA